MQAAKGLQLLKPVHIGLCMDAPVAASLTVPELVEAILRGKPSEHRFERWMFVRQPMFLNSLNQSHEK